MRRIKLPNGGYALHPPFTKAEQQELMRQIAGGDGPRMVAWPRGLRTAGSEAAATNRQTQATTSPTAEAVADQAQPSPRRK
jgi:hypothetical protein